MGSGLEAATLRSETNKKSMKEYCTEVEDVQQTVSETYIIGQMRLTITEYNGKLTAQWERM